MYWSTTSKGTVDKDRFMALYGAYRQKRYISETDWICVLSSGYIGKLEWLEYSLKRSLGIECNDEQEQKLGTEQVISTLADISNYAQQIPVLKEWLEA